MRGNWQRSSSRPHEENLYAVRQHESEQSQAEMRDGQRKKVVIFNYLHLSCVRPFHLIHFSNMSLKCHFILMLKLAFCCCQSEESSPCPMRKANCEECLFSTPVFCEGVFFLNTPGRSLCIYFISEKVDQLI